MSGPNVFISHRHADKAIAETVADFLHQRSSGAATIFCSSSVDHVAPIAGVNLEQSLKKALALCDVVVLVFTSESEDWSFCMWECGVATDPRDQRPTNVVVFQCGENAPKPYVDYLRVDTRDAESVTGFVKTFLTGTDYFPDHEPLTGFASDGKEVKQFGSELHANRGRPAGRTQRSRRAIRVDLPLSGVRPGRGRRNAHRAGQRRRGTHRRHCQEPRSCRIQTRCRCLVRIPSRRDDDTREAAERMAGRERHTTSLVRLRRRSDPDGRLRPLPGSEVGPVRGRAEQGNHPVRRRMQDDALHRRSPARHLLRADVTTPHPGRGAHDRDRVDVPQEPRRYAR